MLQSPAAPHASWAEPPLPPAQRRALAGDVPPRHSRAPAAACSPRLQIPGAGEEPLPSCQVTHPWCSHVIGVKLTPVRLIPSRLNVPQEQRFLINLDAQASFAVAAFHGASSWGNVFL